jgi:pimeloyl-ACP methyl ester carboxylesterase
VRRGREYVLSGGRALGYDMYGPAGGRPVLYFHGTPSSRLDFHMFGSDALVERLGIRFVAVDRPGCGLSAFQPHRTIGEWPADIAELADGLGLDACAVLGWSGGGPYGLACAGALGRRISAAAVVSSMGPFDVPGLPDGINSQSRTFLRLNRERPVIGRLLDRLTVLGARRNPGQFLDETTSSLPLPDQRALGASGVGRAYVDAVGECFRSGPKGGQLDTSLMVGPWDFDPHAIDVPVLLWHGGQDANAPLAMGRWLAVEIPGCRARFLTGEGHISLIISHADEILRSLVG